MNDDQTLEIFGMGRVALGTELAQHTRLQFKNGQHTVFTDDGYGSPFKDHTARQVAWYLEHDKVENKDVIKSVCSVPGCISHLTLDVAPNEDELLALVERSNEVSLAELYRRGKKRGLIQAVAKGYA